MHRGLLLPCLRAGLLIALMNSLPGAVRAAGAVPTRDQLAAADYQKGRNAFLQRCSACHTLADGGSSLVGPNLWGVIGRKAGTSPGFASSPALRAADVKWGLARIREFLAGPEALIPGTRMLIPEPVPEGERTALVSFMLLETGAADWPRPAAAMAGEKIDRSKPLAERYPSFFNHLMTNTTRYRMETPSGEVRFDAYFNADGSVSSSEKTIRGFWNTVERKGMEFFCYALDGIPGKPSQLVECFPIAAMAIPRFADPLWTSKPTDGVTLHGGILAGRP
jgi:cytochrome c